MADGLTSLHQSETTADFLISLQQLVNKSGDFFIAWVALRENIDD